MVEIVLNIVAFGIISSVILIGGVVLLALIGWASPAMEKINWDKLFTNAFVIFGVLFFAYMIKEILGF